MITSQPSVKRQTLVASMVEAPAPVSVDADTVKEPMAPSEDMANGARYSQRYLPKQSLRAMNQRMCAQPMRIVATFLDDDGGQEEPPPSRYSVNGRLDAGDASGIHRRASHDSVESMIGHERHKPVHEDHVGFAIRPPPSKARLLPTLGAHAASTYRPRAQRPRSHQSPRMGASSPQSPWKRPPSWPTSRLNRPGAQPFSRPGQIMAAGSAERKRRIMAGLYRHTYQGIVQVERVVLSGGEAYGFRPPEEASRRGSGINEHQLGPKGLAGAGLETESATEDGPMTAGLPTSSMATDPQLVAAAAEEGQE